MTVWNVFKGLIYGSILKGWYNAIMKENLPEDVKAEALRRANICSACPHLKKSNVIAGAENVLGVPPTEQLETGAACGLCGCGLQAKVSLPGSSCPDNPSRWGVYTPKAVTPPSAGHSASRT